MLAAELLERLLHDRPALGRRQAEADRVIADSLAGHLVHDLRAAGVAPIYAGQPGYREEMDGDLDGVACEPYR